MRLRFLIYAVCLAGVMMTACNKPYDGEGELEFIWFEVSGKVVDMAGAPVKGITVMAESAESVETAHDGSFTVNGGGKPTETTMVSFVDRDDDGKKYVSRTVMVDLVKYKDGHGWNKGYYRNRDEVVVTLTEDAVITPPTFDSGSLPDEQQ